MPEKITPQNPQLQAQKAHLNPIKTQITTEIEAFCHHRVNKNKELKE